MPKREPQNYRVTITRNQRTYNLREHSKEQDAVDHLIIYKRLTGYSGSVNLSYPTFSRSIFMQPSPPDNSITIFNFENPPDISNSSNHGIHSPRLQFSELDSPPSGRVSSTASSTPSMGSTGWRSPFGGVEEPLRGLNLDTNFENRPRPSYQRIAEYENALVPSLPRKQPEGPGFKIVKKKGGTSDEGHQLENFPNGIFNPLPMTSIVLVLI